MANFLKTTEGSRLINAQPKAQKFFSVSKTNINSHFKATAKAQYKANYKPIRGKVASGAAAVMAVITIGKLQLCQCSLCSIADTGFALGTIDYCMFKLPLPFYILHKIIFICTEYIREVQV